MTGMLSSNTWSGLRHKRYAAPRCPAACVPLGPGRFPNAVDASRVAYRWGCVHDPAHERFGPVEAAPDVRAARQ